MIEPTRIRAAPVALLFLNAALWAAVWLYPMIFLALATFAVVAIALRSDQVWTHICAGVLLALLLGLIL